MLRKISWILAPALLAVFFLPKILSMYPGKKIFEKAFSSRFHAHTSIQSIRLSWFGPQIFEEISLNGENIIGHIAVLQSDAPFWAIRSVGSDFHIKDGAFTFPSQGNASLKNVDAALHNHNFQAQGSALPDGRFTLTGKIFSASDFDITGDFRRIPSIALDQALDGQGLLSQALGDLFDLSGSILFHEGKGSLALDLSSSNIETQLRSNLDSRFFRLSEPWNISFRVTPELASSLLRKANPLFLTGVFSKNPITLEIQPEGFLCPWRSFDLSSLQIGQATLDMGSLHCKIGKTLENLLSLFQNLRKTPETDIWFTPVSFSLSKGLLETGRMDALIGSSIHICTWGAIDLIRDRLDMTLGICADTLAHSFDIQKLPLNYVLKVPLRGTTSDPELDTKAAAGKIAAFIAAQQIPKIGGKGAQVFGNALHLFAKAQEDQTDVPQAKRPFPWER